MGSALMAGFTIEDAPAKFTIGDAPKEGTNVPRETKAPDAPFNPLTYAEHEIAAPVESAWEQLKTDWEAAHPDRKHWENTGFWERAKDVYRSNVAAGKIPVDAFNLVTAPLSGAVHGAVIKPIAEGMSYGLNHIMPGFMTEQEAEKGIGQAMMTLGPEAGGLGGAVTKGATREGSLGAALKAPKGAPPPTAAQAGMTPDSMMGRALDKAATPKTLPKPSGPYAEAVKKLQSEGVDLTLGQTHGGTVRRAEETHKSSRYVGPAIREAEQRALGTFNRAVYNRILSPIGEKYTGDVIGRDGVKKVGDMVSKAYDRIKEKLSLKPDDTFLNDVSEIRNAGNVMPASQEKQLESIVNNLILKRLGPTGEMDGNTFKMVEGEISNLAAIHKASTTAGDKQLGEALSGVVGAMRDNLERTSSPEVREELKKINESWAMLTRLEKAADQRIKSKGVVTTGDMLQAIKSGDVSARKRAFARGDALMQDFAETADTVLANVVPDSGTTERLQYTGQGMLGAAIGAGVGGWPGAAIGYGVDVAAPLATNPLWSSLSETMKKRYVTP